ncbi:thiol reductant ABC exporter subunit CydD [Amycolatopsis sp. CA-230715]|uniref:thiol reductant ABC exporter subunit CydD n=1 Tax=Amycolatopsis sp. CA-230715 TaxID=2745196 RepID=UPI001C015BEB|nr:thiol reductant ABC exporter subunit CydD [Amycolatopsis sp. CA-230715]QWF79230.1 ATP-binding/permease protein CydD [Amycolatopsis sp. CA-230715]
MGRLPGLRPYLVRLGVLNAAVAAVVLLLAELLESVLTAPATGTVALLGAVAAVRGLLFWGHGALTGHQAATVKETLRARVFSSLTVRSGANPGEAATLVTKGVGAIDGYVADYLPALVSAVVLPIAVLVRLCAADLASALVIAVTLPLIPVFAILVGKHTKARTAKRWRSLSTLGGHFLDALTGLTTLKLFGRAGAQARVVRAMADAHARTTMRTLRTAFLSGLVLELVATLSVALVAVPVGFRLLAGGLDAHTAVLVLLLAPEAYLPLRAAGARFHASADGLATLAKVGEHPAAPARARRRPPDLRTATIRFDRVTVRHGDTVALSEVDLIVEPGERLALVGPSGAGKSTALSVLLGFTAPSAGRVLVGEADLRELDQDAWLARVAWLPQRPTLFAASITENLALGRARTPAEIEAAAKAAMLDEVVRALPGGYATRLGERGLGLSSGQCQRVGLARALLRTEADLLLFDEPTARLDNRTEAAVLATARALLPGRTAVLVAHRPALLTVASRVVELRGGRIAGAPCAA